MLREVADLPGWLAVAVGVLDLVIRLGALVVVPRNRDPESALAWLLAIWVAPVLGALAYLVIGNPKLPEERREAQARMNQTIAAVVQDARSDLLATDPQPSWVGRAARLGQALGAMPMVRGNTLSLTTDFGEMVEQLTTAVRGARRSVHVTFYVLSHDGTTAPFFDALGDAVRRGVDVQVLFDHLGSRLYPRYRETVRALDASGVRWRLMLPVRPLRGRYQRPDLRNHRKLVVVDGEVAFVGSPNMIDPGYLKRKHRRRGLEWRDTLVRVEGPAVHAVDAVFATDWYSETGDLLPPPEDVAVQEPVPGGSSCQVVPSGPGFDGENNLSLFNAVMWGAERRLSVTSPYFVPDASLLQAITSAAQRGVEVELFSCAVGDQPLVHHAQRSYYEALLRAGVRIWLYPAPYVLHAKHVSVDDDVAVIGSSNLDVRSFLLDLELSMLVSGRDFTDQVRAAEDSYRRVSRELTLEEWLSRPLRSRVLDNLARLTSALQ